MSNKQLAQFITEMARVDQEARFQATPGRNQSTFLVYTIDAVHNYRLHRIIEAYGYPTKSLIGARALRSFLILVQHQDFDQPLQAECLAHCDFAPKERALLTDRVLVNAGKKQIYGTQFYRAGKRLIPRPIADRRSVNRRRATVGLNTLKVNTAEINARNRRKAAH